MSSIRGVTDKFIDKFGDIVIRLITAAIEESPTPLDPHKKPKKVSEKTEALADLLMAQVRLKAESNGVNPTSITTRKDLIQLIHGERDIALLSDWRKDMIGNELLKTLAGDNRFNVTDGELVIHPAE